MQTNFHNTTGLSGDALQMAVAAADKQDAAVLLIYKETGKAWAPSQIHAALQKAGSKALLTSVRRSITNLTKAGDLIALGTQRPGPYGRPEHLWQINPARTVMPPVVQQLHHTIGH